MNAENAETRRRLHVELGHAIANYRALPYVVFPPSEELLASALKEIAELACHLAEDAVATEDIHTLGAAIAAYGSEPSKENAAAMCKVLDKMTDGGGEFVSFSESIDDYLAAYKDGRVGENPREFVIVPVGYAESLRLDYGDLGDSASQREHVRVLRAQQRLPSYPPRERLKIFGADLRPVDCFRCHGDVRVCPMHGSNWRACPHAEK